MDRGSLLEPATTADEDRLERELEVLYDWQQQVQQELAAYEEQQQQRLSATDSAAPTPTVSTRENFLANQLTQMLTAIRETSRNVITVGDPNGPPATPGPGAQERSGGDGSGIVVDAPGGARSRISGSSPDLTGLSLPPGFPAEFPVRVVFSVDPRGEVLSPRLSPVTPSAELNNRIQNAVRDWRFEPAQGSSSVQGSVTIIVETSTRR